MKRSNELRRPPGLDRQQAAKVVGVSVRCLDGMRAQGRGPVFFTVGYQVRYWPEALAAFPHTNQKNGADFVSNHVPVFSTGHPLDDFALLATGEAAALLGLSERTLCHMRSKKVGPRWLRSGRSVRYRGKDLNDYLRGAVPPQGPL